jgi:hypothetical protein
LLELEAAAGEVALQLAQDTRLDRQPQRRILSRTVGDEDRAAELRGEALREDLSVPFGGGAHESGGIRTCASYSWHGY